MRQKIFATQQIAEELLKESVSIWQQGVYSESLEGIEKDPIVSLLMTALAYQENTADHELERLREEVLEDFTQMLIPYDLCHAIPASVIVQTFPEDKVATFRLDAKTTFSLSDNKYTFVPLLNTSAYHAVVKSIVRLDARRWKVSITFKEPLSDLNGFSFMINNSQFKDLHVSIGGRSLSLVKPWSYTDLPLSDCFSVETMLYNRSLTYDSYSTWFDLFAQHNKRFFVVDAFQSEKVIPMDTDKIDFVFEFVGIKDDFVFDKQELLLNCVCLVNASLREASLSPSNPIARLSGGVIDKSDFGRKEQFLHLLRSSAVDYVDEDPFVLRRSAADRFNYQSLLKLVHCLVDKFASDYYAFLQVEAIKDKTDLNQLHQYLKNLSLYLDRVGPDVTASVYLLLKANGRIPHGNNSIGVKYLTTNGSEVNQYLNSNSLFAVPAGLSMEATRVVGEPVLGVDEAQGVDVRNSFSQYFLITHNRLVTPTDIKIFCYNEMLRRYKIDSSMINRILVKHQIQTERTHSGFEVIVDIWLKDDLFIKRNFADKTIEAEVVLQKMIEVRSTNVYPIQVSIHL